MRRWTAAAVGALAALLLAGCQSLPAGIDGDVTDGWSTIGAPTAFTPTAGTCHEQLDESGPMADYRPVPCTELHVSETVALGTFGGPGAAATAVPDPGSNVVDEAYQDCSRKISSFVGGPWRSGRISVNVVLPSPPGWSGGARWYRCDITEVDVNSSRPQTRKGTMARGLTGAAPLKLRCFNPSVDGEAVDRMAAVTCTKTHRAEFAGLWTAPAGRYELLRTDQKRTATGCRTAIARFVGVPDDSDLQYRSGWISYNPTETEWERGERGVQCFVWLSSRPLTRSLQGAGTRGLPIQYR
jgi:hypothetical protein